MGEGTVITSTGMDEDNEEMPEITVSGSPPNQDAVFQIGEGLEECGYRKSAHIHFVKRKRSTDDLIVRIKVENLAEQEIKIVSAKLSEAKSIMKAVIDQLTL
jgi:hypothetical protein